MTRPSGLAFAALTFALTAASVARAQPNASSEGPPPAQAVPAGQAAPQPYAPSPYPVPYPAPYATRPPDAYPAPVPYGGPPVGMYELAKKSPALAFLIEWFLPGGGSIYGDHFTGALISWGLMLGGMWLLLSSLETTHDPYTGASETKVDDLRAVTGVLILLGGRTYGLVDSIVATRNYNEQLRKQLGLAAHFSLDPIPTASGGHVLAPALRLTF
jgi:hypothetical protein